MASFLARAVADEIIPPSVLRNAAFLSLGGEVVKGARRLLSRYGLLWYGMVYDVVWDCMVWYGILWNGMLCCDIS